MNFEGCTREKLADPTHLMLSVEVWFELSRYMNSNCHRITRLLIHEVRECGVCCIVSAVGIVWSIIFFLLQKFIPVCNTLDTHHLRYSSDWISSDFVSFGD